MTTTFLTSAGPVTLVTSAIHGWRPARDGTADLLLASGDTLPVAETYADVDQKLQAKLRAGVTLSDGRQVPTR